MTTFQLCAFADEADPAISGQIRALKENGIGRIELRGVEGQNVTTLTCAQMKELRKRLDDEGIRVWSIGSPIGKIEIGQPFGEHLELFRHTLELAVLAGAEKMRIFSFYVNPEAAADHKQEVIDRLGQMVDAARGSGVVLCHENEKQIYGDIPQRCVQLHEALLELRAVYDPANFIQCGADTMQAWQMLAPYVDYIHMKDARADGVVVPPGEGLANVPKLLENYAAIGGGVITLEPHLSKFVGLAELEREGERSGIECRYANKREAFDAAVGALKAYL